MDIADVATLDKAIVEEPVWHLHQCFVHAVLRVQKAVRVLSFNKPTEHTCGSLNFEAECWAKLFLVTDEDDLLCVLCCQECFVFLDHRGFVHDNTLESAINHLLGGRHAYCCDDAWEVLDHFLLKLILILHEQLKPGLAQVFDLLEIITEKVSHLFIEFRVNSANVVHLLHDYLIARVVNFLYA